MHLYESGEDYLEAVLILQKKMGEVRSVDVARYVGVSKPSVCHAVNVLCDGGFLTKDDKHFISLTEEGRKVAEKIYERHKFFKEQLISAGVSPNIAETEACRIEHCVSDESFFKLKQHHEKDKGWQRELTYNNIEGLFMIFYLLFYVSRTENVCNK